MLGKVTEWKMTEEERLAYIKKHPIRPSDKPRGAGVFGFESVHPSLKGEHRKESAAKARATKDYKWRGKKANESRYKDENL